MPLMVAQSTVGEPRVQGSTRWLSEVAKVEGELVVAVTARCFERHLRPSPDFDFADHWPTSCVRPSCIDERAFARQ
jgi:hypothetical protein